MLFIMSYELPKGRICCVKVVWLPPSGHKIEVLISCQKWQTQPSFHLKCHITLSCVILHNSEDLLFAPPAFITFMLNYATCSLYSTCVFIIWFISTKSTLSLLVMCYKNKTSIAIYYINLTERVCLANPDALQIKAKVLIWPWDEAVADCNLLVILTPSVEYS